MNRITPCLWFDNNAQEAVDFYLSVFKDAEIITRSFYGEGGPQPAGTLLTIKFRLQGNEFLALNGGPYFKFSEAISLMVDCRDQAEVDYYWDALLQGGGQEQQCGWLKDRYGLSWQIVPEILQTLISDPDTAKAQRVFGAVMQMVKLDVAQLEQAAVAG